LIFHRDERGRVSLKMWASSLRNWYSWHVKCPKATSSLDPREENYPRKFAQLEEAWNERQRRVERAAAAATEKGSAGPELFICNLGGELVVPVMKCMANTTVGSVLDYIEHQVEMYEKELYDALWQQEILWHKYHHELMMRGHKYNAGIVPDSLVRWKWTEEQPCGVIGPDRHTSGNHPYMFHIARSPSARFPLGELHICGGLSCLRDVDRTSMWGGPDPYVDVKWVIGGVDVTYANISFCCPEHYPFFGGQTVRRPVRLCYNRKLGSITTYDASGEFGHWDSEEKQSFKGLHGKKLGVPADVEVPFWQLFLPEAYSGDFINDLERSCVCPLSFLVNRLVCPNATGPLVEIVNAVNAKYGEALVGLACSRVVERSEYLNVPKDRWNFDSSNRTDGILDRWNFDSYIDESRRATEKNPPVKSTLNLVCTEADAGSVAEALSRDAVVLDLVTEGEMRFQAFWVHPQV